MMHMFFFFLYISIDILLSKFLIVFFGKKSKENKEDKESWKVLISLVFTYMIVKFIYVVLSLNIAKYFSFSFVENSSWLANIVRLFLCLVIEDSILYWLFRSLRSLTLYFQKYSNSFFGLNLFEIVLSNFIFCVVMIFVCNNATAIILWMLISDIKNYEIHKKPSYFSIGMLLPGFIGSDFHSFFHANDFRCNYAQSFIWWDYICGTQEEYILHQEKRHKEKLDMINKNLFYTTEELKKIRGNKKIEMGNNTTKNYRYVITGGNGQVGHALLKRLVSEGAKKITSLDITDPPLEKRLPGVIYKKCDILNLDELKSCLHDHDILIHTAAVVGVHHKKELYAKININGTLNVIEACKYNKIKVMVICSSTCTRIYTWNVRGAESHEMHYIEGKEWEHEYARTKALGEKAVLNVNNNEFRTCSIAPHHIYGEEDQTSFLKMIEETDKGLTRIMGDGENIYSYIYVGNVAYALHLAANTLMGENYQDCAGKFYVVADGPAKNFWDSVDLGIKSLGFPSIKKKIPIGKPMIFLIALIVEVFAVIFRTNGILNLFVANRVVSDYYWSIKDFQKDTGYEALHTFEDKWCESIKAVYRDFYKKNK